LTGGPKPGLRQALGNKRMTAILLLGFASGLPLNLTGATLQAWLAYAGVDIKTIGIFSLVGCSNFCGRPCSTGICRRCSAGGAVGS
jgi:hypothetical protein